MPSQRRIIHSFDYLLKSGAKYRVARDIVGQDISDSIKGPGGRALKSVCLQPITQLCKMAGVGGTISFNVVDKSKVLLASHVCCVTEDMIKV